jgi:hypothetical protein
VYVSRRRVRLSFGVKTTNKSATLLPVRKGIVSARPTPVKADLLILKRGRPAATGISMRENITALNLYSYYYGRARGPFSSPPPVLNVP